MTWNIDDPQGNEADKVKYEIVQYTRGIVLDMGCGPKKAFPHFIGVDSCKDTQLFGIEIKPDVNCDVADPKAIDDAFQRESVDAVFSSHCLEHIADYKAALAAWWSLIKPGGHLVVYLPSRDLYPNIGQPGANPDHVHDFDPGEIEDAIYLVCVGDDACYDIVVNETRDQGAEYSFLQVYQKRNDVGKDRRSFDKPKPAKTACIVRYGGFGDMIQAANILPALKREGFHVTMMTTPKGQDVLRHDPHVDAWFIQDDDQVPNHELSEFWRVQSRKFDRFINLSESIEGTLLSIPGRANHTWPDGVRRVEMNRNYLEWTSQLAQVPYASESRFYASAEEAAQVKRYLGHVAERVSAARQRVNNAARIMRGLPPVRSGRAEPFVILWVLAGSSVHKFYPGMDAVIARVLIEMPNAAIVLSGDATCQILETGWEDEPRVFRESGEMSIRQTLALAQSVQCVVGPETGVLNAVAFEPDVAKVLLLSHSSVENLSKHWTNTMSISAPEDSSVPICGNRACHRLHYDRTYCPEHKETGAAMCQASIAPERVYGAIHDAYVKWTNDGAPSNRFDRSETREMDGTA